jgi:ubiquinone/menaquinone biosynthesis C-methylase UbiE
MSGDKRPNIYESTTQIASEQERLKNKNFSHPHLVSTSLLEQTDLTNKKFLDIGSGADPELGKLVESKNGTYVAFDYNSALLQKLKTASIAAEAGFSFVRGDAKKLPFKPDSVDIAHERFVLMHMQPADRAKVIANTIGAAKKEALFLEYDWTPIMSDTHPNLIEKFKQASLQLMSMIKIEPSMGEKLPNEIAEVIKNTGHDLQIEEKVFKRKGKFGKEILDMARMEAEVSEKMLKNKTLAEQFTNIANEIQTELDFIELVPADIHAVIVKK